MVTWEPWLDWSASVSLKAIAAGAYDPYIVEAARAAAAWGRPVLVRFAHEMNGGWYPWGRGRGTTPADYRAAWRQIVAIFRQQGATNVRWVWTPYVEGNRQRPFGRYYPGDRWVDWAGLDGFNWGRRFLSFAQVFQRSYETMAKMTRKPLIVAETGSVEYGGSKPQWIRNALNRALPRYKHIRALVWWNDVHSKGTDLRLETSPESLAAWGEALRSQRLGQGRDFVLATPSWLRQ
jgi:beta-mannanase